MKTTTALLSFAAAVAAHGTVPSFSVDGVSQGGFLLNYYYMIKNGQTPPETAGWYAENLDNGFVSPSEYGTADIACHKNSKAATSSATVAAGGKVDFNWSAWPESHIGPVFTYVAKCAGDCADADKTALKWVKIDEAGINLDTQTWAATDLIKNNNTWTTTVPSTLAAGNYVFRHEIIAMHGAGETNGAQNYPQCFNIAITGSGTDNPEGVVATELYTADAPGIKFNPYTTLTSYEIPGPKLYGSGSGSPTKPVTPSGTPTVPSATPSAAPSSPATPTATPTVPEPAEEEPEKDDCPATRRRKAKRAAAKKAKMLARGHSRQFRM